MTVTQAIPYNYESANRHVIAVFSLLVLMELFELSGLIGSSRLSLTTDYK